MKKILNLLLVILLVFTFNVYAEEDVDNTNDSDLLLIEDNEDYYDEDYYDEEYVGSVGASGEVDSNIEYGEEEVSGYNEATYDDAILEDDGTETSSVTKTILIIAGVTAVTLGAFFIGKKVTENKKNK